MPVPATRIPFATIATGMVERAMASRTQLRESLKYPRTMPSVSSETSERMPLQASATSSVVLASTITLPSRSTGMRAQVQRALAKLRRDELQRERNLVEDDRRQRNHQQEKRDRKRQDSQEPGTEHEQHDPGDHDNERDAREEQLGAKRAGHQEAERAEDGGQTDHRRTPRGNRQALPALVHQVERDGDDQKAVRIVLVSFPVPDELKEHIPIKE